MPNRTTVRATADSHRPVGTSTTQFPVASTPSRPRMLTLTLLDGTTVKLPAPSQGAEEPTRGEHLTSRDLVQALLLRAEGKDVSEVLPNDEWQTLFATLLSLLLKKGLLADWEFVEEWTKLRRTKGA